MTDNRNTILAVILSGLVLIAWQYFYNVPQMEKQRALQQTQAELAKPTPQATPGSTTPQASTPTPSANAPAANQPASAATIVARDTAIAATPRIKISTPRLTGSISLKGARIDDLALTQFRETVDPASPPIILFSPSGTAEPYYAEFGWVPASGSTVRLPDRDTQWQQEGSGDLTPTNSGYAEIRQWRRPHLPPHHFDRRQVSVHAQGRRQQCRQRAGDAVSVRADFAPRRAAGLGLLHPARRPDRLSRRPGPAGIWLQENRRGQGRQLQGHQRLARHHRQILGVGAAAGYQCAAAGAVLVESGRRHQNLPDRLPAGSADHRHRRHRHRERAAVRRRQGSQRGRHQFSGLRSWRLQQAAQPQPLRPVDRLGLVLLHHQADVPGARLLLPPDRQFRRRHPAGDGAGQDPVLPARQQILRLDGEDEIGAAATGGAEGALSRRQGEAAAGDDGNLQEGEDQPDRRLSSRRVADSGVLLALQGAVRHHRNAPRAVLRLDQGSVGARSDQPVQPVRPACISIRPRCRCSGTTSRSASGRSSWASRCGSR